MIADVSLGPALRLAIGGLAIAMACSRPHYLGAAMPEPCTERDVEGCLGWMIERDLTAAELGIYDDAALRGYVQSIVDRLSKASLVGAASSAPRVLIADSDETYATAGRRIVISRTTMERLDSEAELAGVLAHELAHIEGRHVMVSLFGRPDDESAAERRDAEAIADERAIWLLEQAGYAPTALGDALDAVLEEDDEDHPPRADRIARIRVLAAGRTGFEGRAEFLTHVEHMVVGRDPRLGHRIGDVWIVPALGLAIDLDEDDFVRSSADVLVFRRQRTTVVAYAIGSPWGSELASTLDDRALGTTQLGRVATGVIPTTPPKRDDSPLGKLSRAIRSTLPQPPPGTRVAILARERGSLLVEFSGDGAIGDTAAGALRVRAAAETELAAVEPIRIAIEHAPYDGTIAQLGLCRRRLLDDPDRRVTAGDPIKCADRPLRFAR